MARPVVLTWKNKGMLHTEKCLLLCDEDKVYAGPHPVTVITDEGVGSTVYSVSQSGKMVMFEDDEGVFGINPYQIVSIMEDDNGE